MELTYFLDGQKKTIKLAESYQDDNLEVSIIKQDNHYQMTVIPKTSLKIESAQAFYHYDYQKNEYLLGNGYQSWSLSKEYPINGKIRGLKFIPGSVVEKYALSSYGDYGFYNYKNRAGIVHSYSYTYIRNASNFTLLGSLDESLGYTVFEHNTKINQIGIIKELNGLEIDRETILIDVVIENGEEIVIDDYFNLIRTDESKIQSLFGYGTGYYYGNNISDRIISGNLQAIKDNELPFEAFIIDEGHQKKIGDWLETDQEKFPEGLEPLVTKTHELGLKAGIYLAPFVASSDSDLHVNHPEWFVKDVKSGIEWGGHHPLNLELKEVQDYLREVFDYYVDLGFDIFKLDFLYAPGLFATAKSKATMIEMAMKFVRTCLQDKTIIACQVPLFTSLKYADIIQVSCNVSKDYDNNRISRLLQPERISAKNAITSSIYRRHLVKSGIASYSDVVVLNEATQLSPLQKEAISFTNVLFNPVMFVSEDLTAIPANSIIELHKRFTKQYKQVKVITHKSHAIIKYVDESECHIVDIDLNTGVIK